MQEGYSVPALRPDFVSAVLQGAKQKDKANSHGQTEAESAKVASLTWDDR